MRLLPRCFLGIVLTLGSHVAAAEPAPLDFDRQVAPLLTQHCLDCHSGLKPKGRLDLSRKQAAFTGGKGGPGVVPGKPDDSTIWQQIDAGRMPPKKKLTAAEQAVIKAWITSGGAWGADPIDPFRFTTAHRAGADWWSLQPVLRPTPPVVKEASLVRNPVDAFVHARLDASGLTPSAEIGRRQLIRRVTFDLLGLPPTPAEVQAFVHDAAPDAYEQLVDRLLASPHYGERWARHWMDVVRFGESNGFERDLPRPNAWPYRDWLIQAFNRDMPYDEFVRWQLAGDVLRPTDPAALRAAGFLVSGAHDTVLPASDKMRQAMRLDELEDLVGTVSQTFLGLTVNCARCHDHKFDPISQKEYYQIAAALAGVDHGERDVKPELHREELARLEKELAAVQRLLTAQDDALRRKVEARPVAALPAPKPLAAWDFTKDLRDAVGGLHGTKFGSARQDAVGLTLDGKTGFVSTEPLAVDIKEKTLEAWVKLDNLTQRGGGVMSLQTIDGVVFDAIVFGEKEASRWLAGSNFFKRTEALQGPEETKAQQEVVQFALTYRADGTITAYRNGQPHGKPYTSSGPVAYKRGQARVVFGVRHEPAGGNKMLAGTVVRARLYDRALTAEEVATAAGVAPTRISEEQIVAVLSAEEKVQRTERKQQAARLSAELAKLRDRSGAKLYTVISTQPPVMHVLHRGNLAEPGEVVSAGGIRAASSLPASFDLKPDAPDGERRLRLARWITDARQPLFARVIVNRLWHYHFGAGLVENTSDLGFNGGLPSHPELLDWLASELVRENWSLKALHRVLVTSATYRQNSLPRPEALRVDANNRLLWRRSPQRLEAEGVRDAMLAVSGRLDPTVGGRGYQDFRSYFFKGTQFYDPVEQIGPEFYRRTLYRMSARGGRNPFLDVFDCPDPSTTTPRRAVTTTPLQALALANNAGVLHLVDETAARLAREVGADADRQVQRLYELAFARQPTAPELAAGRAFVGKHGLAPYCRVLFNINEFIYVD